MHNKRQCLIGIILKSQKGGQVSRKRGQKGGLGRQGPKRRAKGWHPPKRGQSGSYAVDISAINAVNLLSRVGIYKATQAVLFIDPLRDSIFLNPCVG